jgi:hypothetical protein
MEQSLRMLLFGQVQSVMNSCNIRPCIDPGIIPKKILCLLADAYRNYNRKILN